MILTVLLNGFARAGIFIGTGLTFFGGFVWLRAAKEENGLGPIGKDAARFTGYSMVIGAFCFAVLVLNGNWLSVH